MNLPEISAHWLGVFGTGLVIIAYIPQITHLTKMHCGEGVSIPAYALWAAASAFLCVYAIIAKEPVFIALQGYHAAACGLILYFGVKYRNSRCPIHRTGE
jgi:uncharacterized protein with PQ loop repeat